MRRYIVPILMVMLICMVAGALKVRDAYVRAAEYSADYANWPPSAAVIHAKVLAENMDQARCDRFARLFESRFRAHNPPIAVGVKFERDKPIILLFPARMEPWEMDRIAMMAWREAKADLGKTYDFDLFHTYIGLPKILIGKLRTSGPTADLALIDYRSWTAQIPVARRPAPRSHKNRSPLNLQRAPLQGPAVKPPGVS